MKKRLALSLIMIAIVSTLVGGATFAYFSDTGTNTGNTFTAGTLQVGLTDLPQTYAVDITKMAPGQSISGTFTASNEGNLPFDYALVTNKIAPVTGVNIWDEADVTITPASGSIAASGNQVFNYIVTFHADAGNTYQGASGSLNFTVNANQQ